MCNAREKAEMVLQNLLGRRIQDYFPSFFFERSSPAGVFRSRCLLCRTPLSPEHMDPLDGRMPRYMCDRCYQAVALCRVKYRCLTCGAPLPEQKIQSQMRNLRELEHALHDGPCSDFHWFLAGIVLGVVDNRAVAELPPATQWESIPEAFEASQIFQPVEVRRVREPRQVKFLKLPG